MLPYAKLATEAATMDTPVDVALKDPKDFIRIGKPTKRVDSVTKTRGTALFSLDQKVDGMLTAMVERCPYFGGKLERFDAEKAKQVDGVKTVQQVPSGIAVIAKDYWSAMKGRRALSVEWSPGLSSMVDSEELSKQYREMAKRPGRVAETIGDCEKSLATHDVFEAIYEVPFQAHAPMEPLSCLVTLKPDGGADVLTGSQFLGVDHLQVAARLGVGAGKGDRGEFLSRWRIWSTCQSKIGFRGRGG